MREKGTSAYSIYVGINVLYSGSAYKQHTSSAYNRELAYNNNLKEAYSTLSFSIPYVA